MLQDIQFGEVIGEGDGGVIHLAEWKGITVAAKMLKFDPARCAAGHRQGHVAFGASAAQALRVGGRRTSSRGASRFRRRRGTDLRESRAHFEPIF